MNRYTGTAFRPRSVFSRLLGRLRAALAHQRARAELAGLGPRELRDIGLSHVDALPLGGGSPGKRGAEPC
jgi:uncharacterized protein YjiS (DUF1127 family)